MFCRGFLYARSGAYPIEVSIRKNKNISLEMEIKELKTEIITKENKETTEIGRICEVQKNRFTIRLGEREIPAKLKGSFYQEDAEGFPVVGDYVDFKYNPMGESIIRTG